MARGEKSQAQQIFQQSQGVAADATGKGNQLYQLLYPSMAQDINDPQGYSEGDLNAMNTASQQSLGGSVAGAKGEGDLSAARTRNKGGFGSSVRNSTRDAMRQNSTNALEVQSKNANLKEAKRASAKQGASALHGNTVQQLMAAMGMGVNATNAGVNAQNTGWFQNFNNLLRTLNG